MKKQIKKIGLLFSLVLVAFVSFGLTSVKATDTSKSIKVSKIIYENVTWFDKGHNLTRTNLTVNETETIKNQSDESTHTLVIPNDLFLKIKQISIQDENQENTNKYGKDILSGIENFIGLEELDVMVYYNNKEVDLSYLSKLTELKKLSLRTGNYTYSDLSVMSVDLSPISTCIKLEDIYFKAIEIKNFDFSIFKNMKSLKSITVYMGEIGKISNLSIISNLTNLEKLGLEPNSVKITKDVIKDIEKISNIKEFYVKNYAVDYEDNSENKEYILPKTITDAINKYSNMSSFEFKISGGTLSQDNKKAIFSDSARSGDTITITMNTDTVIGNSKIVITYKPNTYEYVEGKSQTYTMNSGKGATFRIDADYSLFKNGGKVFVDNKEVASKYITSKEGSTIITLAEEFLKTLKAGQHEIKVVFSNNVESKAGFVVAEQKTETKTGTTTNTNTNNTTTTTSGTSTTNTSTTKPTDYKSNPDTGIIRLSYADLSVTNAINF